MRNNEKTKKINRLKHFYTHLHQIGDITAKELYEMKQDIKENKDEWFEALRAFDNPDDNLYDLW